MSQPEGSFPSSSLQEMLATYIEIHGNIGSNATQIHSLQHLPTIVYSCASKDFPEHVEFFIQQEETYNGNTYYRHYDFFPMLNFRKAAYTSRIKECYIQCGDEADTTYQRLYYTPAASVDKQFCYTSGSAEPKFERTNRSRKNAHYINAQTGKLSESILHLERFNSVQLLDSVAYTCTYIDDASISITTQNTTRPDVQNMPQSIIPFVDGCAIFNDPLHNYTCTFTKLLDGNLRIAITEGIKLHDIPVYVEEIGPITNIPRCLNIIQDHTKPIHEIMDVFSARRVL